MKVRTIPKTTSLATAGTGAPPQGRARIPWDAAGAGLPNILDMDKHGLRGLFAGEPYRGDQVYGWLFSKGVQDFNDMTDLPKDLRARLASQWAIAYPEVVSHKVSADGTEKFAYALADGCIVESVLIPEKGHYSVCVSSQVGCAMGCRFCLTATRGFTRNLSPGEIVSQVLMPIRAYPERRFTNVVFMGMGEPLLNYPNVIKAANILADPAGVQISKRRVTVSTCGIVPAIETFPRDTEAGLAVSLNATDDETRSFLMPINKKYPLADLLAALKGFDMPRRRRITVEYVLLKGVNDGVEHARRLVRLLHGIRAKVNLIPFNPWPGCPFEAPEPSRVLEFEAVLRDSPFTVMIRKEKGKDILGACGQLAGGIP